MNLQQSSLTLESGIDLFDEVRGEDEDSGMVFDLSKEDRYERVPRDVGLVSFLQEDVRLVQKHDRFPALSKAQDHFQVMVGIRGACAELPSADRVKRLVCDLGDGLSRESLATPRIAAEQANEASSFTGNQVVKSGTLRSVLLHKGRDEELLLISKHKSLEGLI